MNDASHYTTPPTLVKMCSMFWICSTKIPGYAPVCTPLLSVVYFSKQNPLHVEGFKTVDRSFNVRNENVRMTLADDSNHPIHSLKMNATSA